MVKIQTELEYHGYSPCLQELTHSLESVFDLSCRPKRASPLRTGVVVKNRQKKKKQSRENYYTEIFKFLSTPCWPPQTLAPKALIWPKFGLKLKVCQSRNGLPHGSLRFGRATVGGLLKESRFLISTSVVGATIQPHILMSSSSNST